MPQKFVEKIFGVSLDNDRPITYNLGVAKITTITTNKGSKMVAPIVGSQFTTAKSGVTGIVQEVVANKNGTFRVRLDVNGNPRWTTIK